MALVSGEIVHVVLAVSNNDDRSCQRTIYI